MKAISSCLVSTISLVLSSLVVISTAEVFTVPATKAFLFRNSGNKFASSSQTAIISTIRGGSDNTVYGEDADQPTDETELDDHEANEDEEEWEEDQYDREAITDVVVEDEEFVQIEQEEILEEDDDLVAEVEEEEGEEEPQVLTEVLEERMTGTTDDESSAFVDRMELADAYDEGETTTAHDESTALAAASAAKVSGGGDDDDGDAPEEEATKEVPAITEITDEMREALKELKYTSEDVKWIRPEVAAMVLEKGLRRPIEGMPPSFYVDGATPRTTDVKRALIKVSLTLAAVGAVAVLGLNGDIMKEAAKPLAFIAAAPARLQSTIKKPQKAKVAVKTETESVAPLDTTPVSTPAAEESTAIADAEGETEVDDHPHSVKPYSSQAPAFEEHLDQTWLDKVITKIENAIKAVLRIEI